MAKWQGMSKEELETQYSPSRWSPRMTEDVIIEAHEQVISEGTQAAQAAIQTLLNVPYGLGEGEKLDVYLPKVQSETFPLVLYFHGGYWQALNKNFSGFAALPLVTHGIALAVVDYTIAPKGQMDMMVRQVRQSVAFAVQQYTGISGIYLLGHSAGAHLAAMVLSTDWTEYGVLPNIKGAFLVSGIYDLEPIIHTYVNDVLHMTREVALQNSPLQCVPIMGDKKACQLLIVVAQHDSPEYRRQSLEYFEVPGSGTIFVPLATIVSFLETCNGLTINEPGSDTGSWATTLSSIIRALRAAGWNSLLLDIGEKDHFDVIEKLSQEDYLLTQVILSIISRS